MLLTIIAAAAAASTLCGGLLALQLRNKLHLILGFSAGAVIGVAFFDLLPEALRVGMPWHGATSLLGCSGLGFLSYLVLDRIISFHGGTAHRGKFMAGVLCMHSILDGVAIGLAFQTSTAVGIVVALAVLSHDFSDGINTMNVILKDRGSRGVAFRWLVLDSLAPVIGIGATRFFSLPASGFGIALALFGGFFLYIGASDLIPESYHAHPKFHTTAMTLLGAAVLYGAVTLLG